MQSRAGGGRRIKIFISLLVAGLSLLVFPLPGKAATYSQTIYVSAAGSDSTGSGSAAHPYQSIDKAFSSITQDNTLIYIESAGTFDIPGGLESILTTDKRVTYMAAPGYDGQVTFNLQTTESNGNMQMDSLNQFVGIRFVLSGNGPHNGNRFYEYFYDGARINLLFSNCVFDTGPVSPALYPICAGNSLGAAVTELQFNNCDFLSPLSANTRDFYTKDTFINCAFVPQGVYNATAGYVNLFKVTFADQERYLISSPAWQNVGTGTNPDGTQANIGVYGGTYQWPMSIPTVPTGLQAPNVTSSSVELSWPAIPNTSNYIIYENGSEVGITTATTYTVTGLTPNTTYSFQVAAANIWGHSQLSSPLTVTTQGIPPVAPSGLSAGNITNTSFTIYWSKESDAQSYEVYLDGTLLGTVNQPVVYNPSYTVTGLQPGSMNSITIKAVNQFGMSPASQPLSVTTTVPAPVLRVSIDNHNVQLSWAGISGSDSYLVMVNGNQVANVSGNQYTLTEKPGNYQLQVIEVHNGSQYPSNVVSSTVSALVTPGASMLTGGLLGNIGLTLLPMGSLLALALALKASPMMVAAAKVFRKWR
ncbi:exochitinase 1 precursor [Peptococcaceae bacterium CEB3]|nr:exochitinase 1 precursor [Peptococcaceae bacterium CEB3]